MSETTITIRIGQADLDQLQAIFAEEAHDDIHAVLLVDSLIYDGGVPYNAVDVSFWDDAHVVMDVPWEALLTGTVSCTFPTPAGVPAELLAGASLIEVYSDGGAAACIDLTSDQSFNCFAVFSDVSVSVA